MNYERKVILTITELRELIMESWVDGWYNKEAETDDGKRKFSAEKVAKIIDMLR